MLTLRWIMRDPEAGDAADGPVFPPDTIIRAALHAAAATEKPIRVVQDGRLVGVVDRARILESIAGAEDDSEPSAGGNGAGPADRLEYREPPPKVEAVNEPMQETAEFLVETGNPAEPGTRT